MNGIVRCAVCHQKLRVQKNAKGLVYYRHTSKIRGIECTRPDVMVRQERLAEQIEVFIARLDIPDDWQRRLQASLQGNNGNLEDYEQERGRLKKKLQRLKRAYLDMELTDEEYHTERQRVRDRLAAITPPETVDVAKAAITLRTMGDVSPRATLEERRNMLRVIFTAVYVDVTSGDITALEPKPAFAMWVQITNTIRRTRA